MDQNVAWQMLTSRGVLPKLVALIRGHTCPLSHHKSRVGLTFHHHKRWLLQGCVLAPDPLNLKPDVMPASSTTSNACYTLVHKLDS